MSANVDATLYSYASMHHTGTRMCGCFIPRKNRKRPWNEELLMAVIKFHVFRPVANLNPNKIPD